MICVDKTAWYVVEKMIQSLEKNKKNVNKSDMSHIQENSLKWWSNFGAQSKIFVCHNYFSIGVSMC